MRIAATLVIGPFTVPPIPDKTVCITLARRADRWGRFLGGLGDWPFGPVEKFVAFDGRKCRPPKSWLATRGAWAGAMSHLAVVREALDNGLDSLLVLEDDAEPARDLLARWKGLADRLTEHAWDWLYLGGQIKGYLGSPIGPLIRPFRCIRAHAYIVKRSAMQAIVADAPTWTEYVDHQYGRMHARGELDVLCVQPWLFHQRNETSDM